MEPVIETKDLKETGNYTIAQIAEIVQGELHENISGTSSVIHLLTDSRKIVSSESSLFFAIKGDRRDGHEFIPQLIDAGVKNFIVSHEEFVKGKPVNYVVVEDTLGALQKIAVHHRNRFTIPVLGITGSNGKTIVKEWIFQLLREDHHIVRSPKSFNSQIGVPLSIWQMKPDNDFAVFEAGISMPGEMQHLADMIQPSLGIFTNIGQAHDENFSSTEEKIIEKMQLFSGSRHLIFCKDYNAIREKVNELMKKNQEMKTFTWSRRSAADLQIGRISKGENVTEIQGIFKNNFIRIHIPFSDDASVENAIHCWALMLHLGYNNEIIQERMHLLSPVAMRLEMKAGINHCSIINDSYNSDLGSLSIALDFLNQQKQFKKKTIILSDILQSGKDEQKLYNELSALLSGKYISKIIGIGSAISNQAGQFSIEKTFYRTTEDFLQQLRPSDFQNEIVLIKGARMFGFERISKALQQKAHETVLEINLNALVHNLNYYRSRLGPDTKIMCMVKAFAYGSGSFEIANVLQFQGVDYLAVAYADEGVELRKAGITLPIMVMNPEEQSFDAMIAHLLEPEIYSFRILNKFSEAAKRKAGENFPDGFPIHLKIETGMNRLGFEQSDLREMIVRVKNSRQLKIASVFSHLAASDEAEHDGFTKKQIETFTKSCHEIQNHFPYKITRHILNSAGIMRFAEAQFEMVRLGIGLHGIAATSSEQKHLQSVSTLKSTISQIKTVKAGDSIGYNRKAIAQKNMTIGIVGIGYADGFSRKLGNGVGKMMLHGKTVSVTGNVCMDMTMIDITDVPAQEGDEVIIFGNDYSITQFANDMKTIPYEALTGISQRVKRVYFQE